MWAPRIPLCGACVDYERIFTSRNDVSTAHPTLRCMCWLREDIHKEKWYSTANPTLRCMYWLREDIHKEKWYSTANPTLRCMYWLREDIHKEKWYSTANPTLQCMYWLREDIHKEKWCEYRASERIFDKEKNRSRLCHHCTAGEQNGISEHHVSSHLYVWMNVNVLRSVEKPRG